MSNPELQKKAKALVAKEEEEYRQTQPQHIFESKSAGVRKNIHKHVQELEDPIFKRTELLAMQKAGFKSLPPP